MCVCICTYIYIYIYIYRGSPSQTQTHIPPPVQTPPSAHLCGAGPGTTLLRTQWCIYVYTVYIYIYIYTHMYIYIYVHINNNYYWLTRVIVPMMRKARTTSPTLGNAALHRTASHGIVSHALLRRVGRLHPEAKPRFPSQQVGKTACRTWSVSTLVLST